MRIQRSFRRLAALAVFSLAAIAPGRRSRTAAAGVTVYTETNETANAVQVFKQAPDGTLTPGASYPTGGRGPARPVSARKAHWPSSAAGLSPSTQPPTTSRRSAFAASTSCS